ncbi:hypothetical protein L228DRAFT_22132 [Xylona heveae TC161]|uniref:Uncharacterized protein n=1 Tax=Xylona heveae (strain CBS 132557 / TC161) TaxID=1328760 RepID=A0A165K305_XYLHT|nr:hypothetical protein L228DRAFT_22132 [Xylona heveae TC161]KZF26928.1 hypothetical protein L228DRAFT_22132 [Xylona heveae TC161]
MLFLFTDPLMVQLGATLASNDPYDLHQNLPTRKVGVFESWWQTLQISIALDLSTEQGLICPPDDHLVLQGTAAEMFMHLCQRPCNLIHVFLLHSSFHQLFVASNLLVRLGSLNHKPPRISEIKRCAITDNEKKKKRLIRRPIFSETFHAEHFSCT